MRQTVSNLIQKCKGLWGRRKPSPSFLLQVLALALAVTVVLNFQTDFNSQNRGQVRFAISPELLEHMVFGYRAMAADLLWVRVLQDIDYKDNQDKGWVFNILDAITEMEPRFEPVYTIGAPILSVIVHDKSGAAILYEKAVKQYPTNWGFAYYASFHYLYEVKDCKRAAELFAQAVQNGAPAWVAALSGRLFVKSGQYDIARSVILDTMEKLKDHTGYYLELQKRLKQLDDYYHDPKKTALIDGLNCAPVH